MIVTSMSNLEIWKALNADCDKLRIRAESLIPKISKKFKKEGKFPTWTWDEYEHQGSRNKYLIMFHAATLALADNPSVKFLALVQDEQCRIVVQWGYWQYRKNGSLKVNLVPYIGYFSSHLFRRYRERIWKDSKMPYQELLCRYFFRNEDTIPIELNKDIQRKYKEYGELAAYAFQVRDGICFIRQWNEGDELSIGVDSSDYIAVALYYTIVNNGMMTETQNKAIIKEEINYISKYYRNLIRDALTGSFNCCKSIKDI